MDNIHFPNPLEAEKNNSIEKANSFDALYEAIRALGEVDGTRKTYTAEELIRGIEQVRNGERPPEYITRSLGIRDAVKRMLLNKTIFFKNEKESRN